MLDRLHEEGLVERRAASDRPAGAHPVADAGAPAAWSSASSTSIRRSARRPFAGLAPGTRDALIAALGRIKDNLTLEEEAADGRADARAGRIVAEPPLRRSAG